MHSRKTSQLGSSRSVWHIWLHLRAQALSKTTENNETPGNTRTMSDARRKKGNSSKH